jgi:hypothetical protein
MGRMHARPGANVAGTLTPTREACSAELMKDLGNGRRGDYQLPALRARHGFDVGERTELMHGGGACAALNNAGKPENCRKDGSQERGCAARCGGGRGSRSRGRAHQRVTHALRMLTPIGAGDSNRRTLGETRASSSRNTSTGLGACPDYAGGSRRTAKGNRATRAESGEVGTFGGRGFDSPRVHCRETGHIRSAAGCSGVGPRHRAGPGVEARSRDVVSGPGRASRPGRLQRDGAAAARRPHKPEVLGSSPSPAISFFGYRIRVGAAVVSHSRRPTARVTPRVSPKPLSRPTHARDERRRP